MMLAFESRGEGWTIACDSAKAPRTLAALAAALPMALQLHTPKIAGSHIYWHAPFVEDAEGAVDVLQARPGAFVYWPGRQFLELIFAPLQAETASITVLGHVEGSLDRLVALGSALREGHGCRPFDGRLTLIEGTGLQPARTSEGVPGLADLRSRRDALWAACPDDVDALTRSRAIMHPAGPLFMAEAEARVLHETLWWIRTRLSREAEADLRHAAALSCDKAATRLRDFCHFGSSAAVLSDLERAFGHGDVPLAPLVDEAILIAGRLAAWLDLKIPWSAVNDAMRRALDAGHAP